MSENKALIEVQGVYKEFILPQSRNSSFKQSFVNIVKKNNKVTQKVLNDISFNVNKGDFFGIVGRNGSGKSTLLKMLAGVYTPTKGSIHVNGKLTPFIELGVGFNPELSGRDNVYLNGALLGFNRKQMDSMYEEIVSFAELEPFMDQKLKNYSSGMQVRLAFSIAIKAKNEILIFDEVLAVGDEAFQQKCLDVFDRYKAEGQTVILVTHEMETVKKYCNRAILIHEGELVTDGAPRKVADQYSRLNQDQIDKDTGRRNDNSVSDLKVTLKSDGQKRLSYKPEDTMSVTLEWKDLPELKSVGVNVFKQSGEHVTGANTLKDSFDISGMNSVTLSMELPLQPGKYYVLAEAFKEVGVAVASNQQNVAYFSVTSSETDWSGITRLPHMWRES